MARIAKSFKIDENRLKRFEAKRQQEGIGAFTYAVEAAMDWWIRTFPHGSDWTPGMEYRHEKTPADHDGSTGAQDA